MISDLLELADRLVIQTPAPFEKRLVHYFLDLDIKGQLIEVSPTCGRTADKEDVIGKEYNCPVFFPIELDSDGEKIKATAGGGKAVPELLTGDIQEIFHTKIEGKPPQITILSDSVGNELAESSEPDKEDSKDEASDTPAGKNQFYRCKQWKELHKRLFEQLNEKGQLTEEHQAIQGFLNSVTSLDKYLDLFHLPNPPSGIDDSFEEAKVKRKAAQVRSRWFREIANSRFAFRVCGNIMLWDRAIQEWWDGEYRRLRSKVAQQLPDGADMFGIDPSVEDIGSKKLTTVFPHISGVPNGGAWCPFASFDKAPFQSYGLGKTTTRMTLRHSERVAAALNLLLRNETNSFKLSQSVKAVFWAVDTSRQSGIEDIGFVELMKRSDPLQVLEFLKNIRGHAAEPPDTSKFFCALISSPKARITIRSWHTDTLPQVIEKSRKYFEAVTLPDIQTQELQASTIAALAEVTVRKSKDNPPQASTFTALVNTAFFGLPLPHHIFQQIIQRQRMELAKGDDGDHEQFLEQLRNRTAFIKLYFAVNNTEQGVIMSIDKHEGEKHPAYLCGRLLAILDAIHAEAHPKLGKDGQPMRDRRGIAFCASASSPADRMYGAASKTPALVFPQLCDRVRYHLNKIEAGMAAKLELGVPSDRRNDGVDQDFDGLAAVVTRLKEAAGGNFPRMLSLEEQGRFAMGFYYERCRKWPNFKQKQEVVATNNGEEN